jgi:hypothetical protein
MDYITHVLQHNLCIADIIVIRNHDFMPEYFESIIIFGVIFGLGHFYFGYVYHIKKTSLYITGLLLLVAISLHLLLYKTVFAIANPDHALIYFYLVVLSLFVFHHCYDVLRLGGKKQAIAWFIYGASALGLIYGRVGLEHIGALMIWSLVYHHYIYWIYLTIKKTKGLRRKKFIREAVIVHSLVCLLYFVGHQMGAAFIGVVFSLSAFHHLTSVHIIFSTLKEIKLFQKFD